MKSFAKSLLFVVLCAGRPSSPRSSGPVSGLSTNSKVPLFPARDEGIEHGPQAKFLILSANHRSLVVPVMPARLSAHATIPHCTELNLNNPGPVIWI